MLLKKDVLFFLAGAMTFHTVAHMVLYWSGLLPLTLFGMVITEQLNVVAIIVNLLITIGLLYYAFKVRR